MDASPVSRRSFIKRSSLSMGAGVVGVSCAPTQDRPVESVRLPSEVCLASVDLKGLWPEKTRESRIRRVLERMEEVAGIKPDIICLPELFDSSWVAEQKPLSEIAEDEQVPGPITSRLAEFARRNNCYVVSPVFTKKDGNFYNSSIILDRKGMIAGVYHKTHPTKTEIYPDQAFQGGGTIPGAIDQPLVNTDFGKLGMQICFDANWTDGWDNLRNKGADIVLFSSQFPGGRMLNYYARQNSCYIVSSTGGDARIIDISGNDLDGTSEFVRYAWAKVNLDRVTVTTWPTRDKLPDLFKKYGDRLGIKVWGNAGVITIESRDPQLKVKDVLKEFNIPTYAELLKNETAIQEQYRLA